VLLTPRSLLIFNLCKTHLPTSLQILYRDYCVIRATVQASMKAKKNIGKWKEIFLFPACVGLSQIPRMQIPIPLWTCQDIELGWMCCYFGFCLGCSATQSFRKFNLFPSPLTIVANFLFFPNSIFVLLFSIFHYLTGGSWNIFWFWLLLCRDAKGMQNRFLQEFL